MQRKVLQKLFIVDDDPEDRLLLKESIYTIDPALIIVEVETGNKFFSLLESDLPDLIFLDLDMPEINGLQCLHHIRSTPSLEMLPIVVFSSTTRSVNIDVAYEVGADLFFIKPFTYAELTNAVRAILRLDWIHPKDVKEQYCVNGRYVAFM